MTFQPHPPKTDLEIARSARMKPIRDVARDSLQIPEEDLEPFGHYKAKLSLPYIRTLENRPDGKLILVTAISPTPAGEGKTTAVVGLADGMKRIGRKALICLREPSIGPCFGQKGGAAGGGHAQVVPMADINLHFTGDFHAITAANNLLAAMLDNHIYWGNALEIDSRRVTWRRVMDMNDRALREIVNGLGGVTNGFPRHDHFDITVASEVMAIFCLARDLNDLKRRLGNIIVAYTRDKKPVFARDLNAHGAMTVLLKEAFQPNLAQTLENNPTLIHGGPFANIAHGCNSVLATKTALKLADYVITEAGFGADLGAEKFFNIKCRKAGLKPDLAILVATVRALKMHGGVEKAELGHENVEAVLRGGANLARHVDNLKKFGLPVLVAINRFTSDTQAELDAVRDLCASLGVEAVEADHWAEGGRGAERLAEAAVALLEARPASFRLLYAEELPIVEKIRTVAREIYGAADIAISDKLRTEIEEMEAAGYGRYPVCIAKTQYSFSTDPARRGAPSGHTLTVREVRLANGAEFIVVICGDIMTMPGLPRHPAANEIDIDESGEIVGLF